MANRSSRILLVDDYPANVLVTSLYLEDFGYTCDVAMTGAEALAKALSGDYAAILMDIQLPDMNGLDVTRAIRQHEIKHNLSGVCIIGLTAHAMIEDRLRCLAAGMNDYLSKPFNPDQLRTLLAHNAPHAAQLVAA
jgi:CheY-like chemotaxis protein